MRIVTAVACACVITTIGIAANQPRTDGPDTWAAPPAAVSVENPLAERPDTAAGGKKLFQQRCSMCHGADGTGTNRGANLTLRRVQDQSDGALFWKISSGNTRTGMPSFSFLPVLQRWQLVKHLRSLAGPS